MLLKNTATWDRMLRIAIGLLMLGLGWYASLGSFSFPLRIFALYPLITGLAGWCPIYALFRFSSRR